MRDRYEPSEFEPKWRQRWLEADLYKTREDEARPKFYGLEFFPYPSGAGLSVGHCRNYIPSDVLCRMKFMQGFNVLHPMGFDAFGLPAENEAIKTKRQPGPMVEEYGETYRRQMDLVAVGYDWSRSFYSCDPNYYKWTQWIFELLYKKGLAFRKNAEVNWCPKDKTALANEEVVGGLCERCGTPVEKRAIPQWFFKITDYAQRLLDDLDDLDWPDGIKLQQRNWIGRSEGVEFEMRVVFEETPPTDTEGNFGMEFAKETAALKFRVFTTRIDTIFGMTFCVLAPEHPVVATIKTKVGADFASAIEKYQAEAKTLSDMDRQATTRAKSGAFTGAYAINPATHKKVPIYIADYVLMGYGTGAIMAVPGHDQRDLEFAIQHGIDVVPVITPTSDYLQGFAQSQDETIDQIMARYLSDPKAFQPPFLSKDSALMNSGDYNGQVGELARTVLGQWIEACGIGERKVNYKLRDWLISRQRYWGCPIPVIYHKSGEQELVDENYLPVLLPDVDHYEPADDGSSPLSRISEFVNVTTSEGTLGHRETDTMGGFACSSWYFLRFCDPHNDDKAFDPAKVKYWMPVDCYVGGAEHAVMHLLYARFWTKVLFDLGLVDVKEPFQRLINQGSVLALTPYRDVREGETLEVGEDGILVSFKEAETMDEKDLTWKWVRMSKSKGNVVTPEEAVERYGADALRVYEMYVAPFEQNVQWSTDGIQGSVRFLSRVMKFCSEVEPYFDRDWPITLLSGSGEARVRDIRRITHKLIRKATQDIAAFACNTYISASMIALNSYNDLLKAIKNPTQEEAAALSEAVQSLVLVLAPSAPHTCDEIWEGLGLGGFTYHADWPQFNPDLAVDDVVTVAVQVNGKLRDTLSVAAGLSNEDLQELALASAKVQAFTTGLTVRKVIVIPDKLVNIVVG